MVIMEPSVGPILGHASDIHANIWARLSDSLSGHAVSGSLLIWPDADISACRLVTFDVDPSRDHSGLARVEDLQPNTLYRYQVGFHMRGDGMEPGAADFRELPTFRLRTAPAGPTSEINFIFGSCREIKPGKRLEKLAKAGDQIFASIELQTRRERIDAILMIGDQIYADKVKPQDEDFLPGYFSLYRSAFSQPNIARLMANTPTYMTLDDHEIKNGWNGESDNQRTARRFRDAMQAFDTYQISHAPPMKRECRRYYSFEIGAARFFMMDVRTERFREQDRMISPEQLEDLTAWLEEHAASRGANFIVTAVPFLEHAGRDKWRGFKEQRLQILEAIFKSKAQNIVFLSGDLHTSSVAQLSGAPKPIYSIISSPFYRRNPIISSDPNYRPIRIFDQKYWVTSLSETFGRDNYATVKLSTEALDVAIHGPGGQVKVELPLPLFS